MSTALLIAYHYPPCFGSSGIHRTLSFSRDLGRHGWRPVVLSVHPRAYPAIDRDRLTQIPDDVIVSRAFALDAQRHLAFRQRTLRHAVMPDRWATWWLGAMATSFRLIRKHRPAVVWSTAPIVTAHLIGLTLNRLYGIPWVADFRDPITGNDHPADTRVRRVCRWIEERTVERAARLVFTTPSMRDMYVKRYPLASPERFTVIPNGYNEDDFAQIRWPADAGRDAEPLRLLHSGTIYSDARNPRTFLAALSRLKRAGRVSAATLRVELRGTSMDRLCHELIDRYEVRDLVHVLPALPFHESLQEAAGADALLILQDASCNAQVPAKAYEYLRLGKPILGLTAIEGDTAALLTEAGGATLVDLEDEAAIERRLPAFLAAVRDGSHPRPDAACAARYARHLQAEVLADCLRQAAGTAGGSRR